MKPGVKGGDLEALLREWGELDETQPTASLPAEKLWLLADLLPPYVERTPVRVFRILKVLYSHVYRQHLTRPQYVAALKCGLAAQERGGSTNDIVTAAMKVTLTLLGVDC